MGSDEVVGSGVAGCHQYAHQQHTASETAVLTIRTQGGAFISGPYPKPITFTVEEPHRMAERAKGECYVNRAHKVHELVSWIKSQYLINFLGSLPKEDVYRDYLDLCAECDKEPLSKAMLGKILHQAFPTITCNRLGPRGMTKHCYKGLQRRHNHGDPSNPEEPTAAPMAAAPSLSSMTAISSGGAAPIRSPLPPYTTTHSVIRRLGPPRKKRVKLEKRDEEADVSRPLPRDVAEPIMAHKEENKNPGNPTNNKNHSDIDEDNDDDSDFEQQLEVPEHSSEGQSSSDWEGDGGGGGDLNYLELMKSDPSLRGATCPQRPSFPNGVSDSLLQFLRASPNGGSGASAGDRDGRAHMTRAGGPGGGAGMEGYHLQLQMNPSSATMGLGMGGCCGCENGACASPQINAPPYISLLSMAPPPNSPYGHAQPHHQHHAGHHMTAASQFHIINASNTNTNASSNSNSPHHASALHHPPHIPSIYAASAQFVPFAPGTSSRLFPSYADDGSGGDSGRNS